GAGILRLAVRAGVEGGPEQLLLLDPEVRRGRARRLAGVAVGLADPVLGGHVEAGDVRRATAGGGEQGGEEGEASGHGVSSARLGSSDGLENAMTRARTRAKAFLRRAGSQRSPGSRRIAMATTCRGWRRASSP